MEEIRFDEENEFARPSVTESGQNAMADWLVSKGIVPNRTLGEYVLLGVVVIAILATFFVWRTEDDSAYLSDPVNQRRLQEAPGMGRPGK